MRGKPTIRGVDQKRRLIVLGAASASFNLSWHSSVFATENLSAKRLALVFGNAAYPSAPLKNPRRDATDVADALRRLNFGVAMQVDSTLATMRECLAEFCREVNRTHSAALFYFSGHGVQINWRNYLLPVDLRASSVEDIQKTSLDVSAVTDGLRDIPNAANILILDACRNNPFGRAGTTGKGLSQIDAPPNTLLAYATSPGNTASDGSGTNGLYTGALLSELQRRGDAKVEDLFKRVRLTVRRQSGGSQIPWESTSLENDFYFKLPIVAAVQQPGDPIGRRFEEDSRDWTAAKVEGTVDAFRRYLDAHPNGQFSEIAQASLDRLLAEQGEQRISIVSSAGNPFTQGSAEVRNLVVGDLFEYRFSDGFSGSSRRSVQKVTALKGTTVEFNNGEFTTDLLGNPRVDVGGAVFSDNQLFAKEYAIGRVWTTKFSLTDRNGKADLYEFRCKVVARENKEVPAGRFNAFRVEAEGWKLNTQSRRSRRYWIAPESVSRFIALERVNWNHRGRTTVYDIRELVSFGHL
jgi:hypothetical protein